MAATHRHRAVEKRVIGWGRCVDPKRCPSAVTHGNVVIVERCWCGAYRETECNGLRKFRGPWRDEPYNWTKW